MSKSFIRCENMRDWKFTCMASASMNGFSNAGYWRKCRVRFAFLISSWRRNLPQVRINVARLVYSSLESHSHSVTLLVASWEFAGHALFPTINRFAIVPDYWLRIWSMETQARFPAMLRLLFGGRMCVQLHALTLQVLHWDCAFAASLNPSGMSQSV